MSAIFSACGFYRYRLERQVMATGKVAFICCVNPSKAGVEINDQSVTKMMGFCERNGIARFMLGNKFAGIATDVNDLPKLTDPIGPENDTHLRAMMEAADIHIVGWGALSKLPMAMRQRWKDIVRMADGLGVTLHCIGTNADKSPKHPLMTGYDVPITPWESPWFPNRKLQREPISVEL